MSGLLLVWTYPEGRNVFFRVYEQDVRVPTPYETNSAGKYDLRCDVVTTSWLTNGWRMVGATWETNYAVVNAGNDGLLHAFMVTAVDMDTGLESEPATK